MSFSPEVDMSRTMPPIKPRPNGEYETKVMSLCSHNSDTATLGCLVHNDSSDCTAAIEQIPRAFFNVSGDGSDRPMNLIFP